MPMSLTSFARYFSPVDLSWYCQSRPIRDKDLRAVHGALSEGRCEPESIFMERLRFLSTKAIEANQKALLLRLGARSRIIGREQNESLGGSMARASMEPPGKEAAALRGPGRWAPQEDPQTRLDQFLSRRERHSWSREIRQGRPRSILDDALLLSMMRRISPEKAPQALDFGLLLSALAWDASAVHGFLQLGADPLRPSLDGGALASQKNLPLAAAILMRHPVNPSHEFAYRAGESDELLLGALFLAEACVPQPGLLLPIPPAKGRPSMQDKRAPDILALAWDRSLVHCARRLAQIAPRPLASAAWAREHGAYCNLAQEGPQKEAMDQLAAQVEAREIAQAAAEASPVACARVPRL